MPDPVDLLLIARGVLLRRLLFAGIAAAVLTVAGVVVLAVLLPSSRSPTQPVGASSAPSVGGGVGHTAAASASPETDSSPVPAPTVTQYITVAAGGGSSAWVAVAALGALVGGLGTAGAAFVAYVAIRRQTSTAPEPKETSTA